MKIVFSTILVFGALLAAVTAKPFAEGPSDDEVITAAVVEAKNEDKILNTMMNHIVASVMQSNDDGSNDLMSMMMGENNASGEQCAKLQRGFLTHVRRGLRKFIRSRTGRRIIRCGFRHGIHVRCLGKK